jgi:hypothetical protein
MGRRDTTVCAKAIAAAAHQLMVPSVDASSAKPRCDEAINYNKEGLWMSSRHGNRGMRLHGGRCLAQPPRLTPGWPGSQGRRQVRLATRSA